MLWLITIPSTSLGCPLGGVGEAGWTRCSLLLLRNNFTISHCEGFDFRRQPTGQSKRTGPANRTLPSPAGAGLLFQEGTADRSFTLPVPSVPQKVVPLFILLQLPSQNGFSCPSPQQAETRSAGQSTWGWLCPFTLPLFLNRIPHAPGLAIHSPAPRLLLPFSLSQLATESP